MNSISKSSDQLEYIDQSKQIEQEKWRASTLLSHIGNLTDKKSPKHPTALFFRFVLKGY